MSRDAGLDNLLELNDTEYHEENGYWYKIEVSLVEPSAGIPHGIRYNLTLHDSKNRRVFGFDNAHAPKVKKAKGQGKYKGRIVEYDHVHKSESDPGTPYKFKDAQTLMSDFLDEVTKRVT